MYEVRKDAVKCCDCDCGCGGGGGGDGEGEPGRGSMLVAGVSGAAPLGLRHEH